VWGLYAVYSRRVRDPYAVYLRDPYAVCLRMRARVLAQSVDTP